MAEKQELTEEAYIEKLRSIYFGGISTSTSEKTEDTPFKRKLETDLSDLVKDGSIPTEIADAQAAIAGLCKGKDEKKKEPVL